MKTLFLEKDCFVRIKGINNKLIMFYSKFDKTGIEILDPITFETLQEIELSIEYTIADIFSFLGYYYVVCYNIYNQLECILLTLDEHFNMVDKQNIELIINSGYVGVKIKNDNIDLYFSNKMTVGENYTRKFLNNKYITVNYINSEESNEYQIFKPEAKLLGYQYDDEKLITLEKDVITTYDINNKEMINQENIISPVNTEQMVMINDDIICLITDECQYVLVNNVVQKIR